MGLGLHAFVLGALSYRKLFDGRAVQSSMTGEEPLAVCARIRAYHGARACRCPIVCTPEQTVEFARLLGALASADRPIKMFSRSATGPHLAGLPE